VLTPVHPSCLKDTISHPDEHASGLAIGREPTPEKHVPNLKTAEFRITKILLNSFMKENNVGSMVVQVIFQKGSVPRRSNP
jgi:hypothetical protein